MAMAGQPKRWRRVEAHGPGHPLAWVIWSVPALFFLYEFILRIAPSLVLPELEQELNLTAGGIGAALGAYYYAYAPMQLVVGVLLDRFGSRRLLSLAAVICVAGLVVAAGVSTAAGLAASRFLLGLGSAFAYIGAVYVAMTWFPARRVALLAGLTAGVGFGGAVGGEFLLQMIFGTPPDWANGMWILAAAGLVLTIAIWITVPERPNWHLERTGRDTPHDRRSVINGLRAVVSHRSTWLVSTGCALMYLPLAFAGNWGPRDLHTVLGFDTSEAPRIYALFYIGVGVGCPLVGWLSDRSGRRKPFLVVGSIAAASGTLAMTLLPEQAREWAWFILPTWGLVVSTYVLGYPLAMELNRRDAAGTAIAFVNFIGMLLAGLMVWLFGTVVDSIANANGHSAPQASDFRWGMGVLAAFMLLALVAHLLVREPRRESTS
ncbi:MAG: MFS transporter [Phycisphaerales bacterium]|nr:MFS transporter [Phycisphaerales bacterium]